MSIINKDRLLKNGRQLLIVTGVIASRFIVFFQQIVAARYISKSEFGLATLSFSIISVLLPVLSVSFAELSYRYAYDTKNSSQAYDRYSSLISRVMLVSFGMFAGAGCILYLLGFKHSYPFHNIVYVYANFWFVQVLGLWRVTGKDFLYSIALIRYSILSIGSLCILLVYGWGYEALPVSAVFAFVVSFLFNDVRLVFGHICSSFSNGKSVEYIRLIYDAVLVSITNMISQAYLYIDIFIAAYFFAPSDIADLRAPSLIVIMASVFPVMFFSYYAPRIARAKEFSVVNAYYKLYLKIALPLSVVGFLLMFFAAKSLIIIMYGDGYASAEMLFQWYAAVIIINVLVRAPIGNILALQGCYKFNLILSSAFLLVMVMLQFMLSSLLGVIGIPIATLLVAIAAGGVSLRYYFTRLSAA